MGFVFSSPKAPKAPPPPPPPPPPPIEPPAAIPDTSSGDEARKRLKKRSGFAQTFKVKGPLEPFLTGKRELG